MCNCSSSWTRAVAAMRRATGQTGLASLACYSEQWLGQRGRICVRAADESTQSDVGAGWFRARGIRPPTPEMLARLVRDALDANSGERGLGTFLKDVGGFSGWVVREHAQLDLLSDDWANDPRKRRRRR